MNLYILKGNFIGLNHTHIIRKKIGLKNKETKLMQDSFSELKQPSASGPGHFSWLFLKQEPNSVQLRGVLQVGAGN